MGRAPWGPWPVTAGTSWWVTGDPGSMWQLLNVSGGQTVNGALTGLILPRGAAVTLGGDLYCSVQKPPALAGQLLGACAYGTVAAPGCAVPRCVVLCHCAAPWCDHLGTAQPWERQSTKLLSDTFFLPTSSKSGTSSAVSCR